MVIGGALFGIFAGITYWFPKVTGIKLNEQLGKYSFWCWIIGFLVSFVPLYILGFMGATRRLDHYDASTGWQPLFIVSALGAFIIAAGVAMQILQIIVSIIQKNKIWIRQVIRGMAGRLSGRHHLLLHFYNFAIIPEVTSRDAFWEKKSSSSKAPKDNHYEDIILPKNTAMGIYISALVFLLGFAVIWHIIWLAVLGLGGALVCFIIRAFDEETEYILPAKEVAKIEAGRNK